MAEQPLKVELEQEADGRWLAEALDLLDVLAYRATRDEAALRDAALLRYHLVEADRGRSGLLSALHGYESAMLEYGFTAVQRSLQVSDAVTSTNVVVGWPSAACCARRTGLP